MFLSLYRLFEFVPSFANQDFDRPCAYSGKVEGKAALRWQAREEHRVMRYVV